MKDPTRFVSGRVYAGTEDGDNQEVSACEHTVPGDQSQACADNHQHEPHAKIQTVRGFGHHDPLLSPDNGRYGCCSPAPGFGATLSCFSAAAPSMPPMPSESTALLGMSISAPFSFSPSYSMFIARSCSAVGSL
jgi:hypothetical protein